MSHHGQTTGEEGSGFLRPPRNALRKAAAEGAALPELRKPGWKQNNEKRKWETRACFHVLDLMLFWAQLHLAHDKYF